MPYKRPSVADQLADASIVVDAQEKTIRNMKRNLNELRAGIVRLTKTAKRQIVEQRRKAGMTVARTLKGGYRYTHYDPLAKLPKELQLTAEELKARKRKPRVTRV